MRRTVEFRRWPARTKNFKTLTATLAIGVPAVGQTRITVNNPTPIVIEIQVDVGGTVSTSNAPALTNGTLITVAHVAATQDIRVRAGHSKGQQLAFRAAA